MRACTRAKSSGRTVHTASRDITAVIPARDAAPFLADAIDSVRAQSRPVKEIIVVDDASTDDTAAIAEARGARVIRHTVARGNGATRNTGVRAARTDLVALLDADDLWLPHHCATVAGLLESNPPAAVAYSALKLFGDGVGPDTPLHTPPLPPGRPIEVYLDCLRKDVGQPSACVIWRDRALAIDGFDEEMPLGVDFDFNLRLSERFQFVVTHEVTALYRRHGAQLSVQRRRRVPWCIRARARACERAANLGSAESLAAAAALVHEIYRPALQEAWDHRRRDELKELVSLELNVPGIDQVQRRWRRRLLLPQWLVNAWFAADGPWRDAIRRRIHRIEGID